MVYLIHFSRKYAHAGHYIGYCRNDRLDERMKEHRENHGGRLLQVINEAGITWECVRTWKRGTRKFERKLKNRKNASKLCPFCKRDITKQATAQDAPGEAVQ